MKDYNFQDTAYWWLKHHPVNMMIARKLLEKRTAGCPLPLTDREALDILMHCEPNEFQAVLMDIRMPVLNGIQKGKTNTFITAGGSSETADYCYVRKCI